MAMRLTGPEMGRFNELICEAFDLDSLTLLLSFRLNKKLINYSTGGGFPIRVFKVVEGANMEGWISGFVAAAVDSRPNDAALLAFAQDVRLASPVERDGQRIVGQELEAIVDAETPFADAAQWLANLGELLPRVCRVEISNKAAGTGFLVGKNVAMTNRHVLARLIDGNLTRDKVGFRFDYLADRDGLTVRKGRVYDLAEADWLLDSLPHSPADLVQEPDAPPSPAELDFALVRLAGSPGEDPRGTNPEPGAPKRGWITVPDAPKTINPGQTALILQHPSGTPLKIATGAAQAVNENQTRQRYSTNTEPGSSGSPVFNFALQLCLLHHSGDPQYVELAQYNQGIPVGKILDRLDERGLKGQLGN